MKTSSWFQPGVPGFVPPNASYPLSGGAHLSLNSTGVGGPASERFDEGLVELMGLLVAARHLGGLLLETAPLLVGVVELGEGVGDLHAAGEGLPALDHARLRTVRLGEGRELGRIVE